MTRSPAAMRLCRGVTVRALPDGDAVVADAAASEAIIVNESAHALLELLAEERNEEEIVAMFCGQFPDQDPEAIRRDVTALVAQLLRAGFVEPCGTAASNA